MRRLALAHDGQGLLGGCCHFLLACGSGALRGLAAYRIVCPIKLEEPPGLLGVHAELGRDFAPVLVLGEELKGLSRLRAREAAHAARFGGSREHGLAWEPVPPSRVDDEGQFLLFLPPPQRGDVDAEDARDVSAREETKLMFMQHADDPTANVRQVRVTMTTRKSRPSVRSTPESERYAALSSILRLVRALELTQGMTTAALLEGHGLKRRTFMRYRAAIDAAGLPLVSEARGREKVWRILPEGRRKAIHLREAQAIALLVQRRGTTFLAETGFEELLEDVYGQVEASLNGRELARVRNLDRKIFDRNDEAVGHVRRAEDVDQLVSALLYDERLDVRYRGRREPFVLEPYTLLIYRKGLYVIGYSHKHEAVRRFALDRIDAIDRRRGDRFSYPSDVEYHPAKFLGDAFGIAGDAAAALVRVRFFGETAIEAVDRRRLHPSQEWETKTPKRDGSRVLRLRVAPDDWDLDRWVLGFGADAQVLAPTSLVERIGARAKGAAERYRARI